MLTKMQNKNHFYINQSKCEKNRINLKKEAARLIQTFSSSSYIEEVSHLCLSNCDDYKTILEKKAVSDELINYCALIQKKKKKRIINKKLV
jgi:hypothetical protein